MIRWQGKSTYVGLHGVSMRLPDQIIYQLDDELISDLNIQEYRKHIALVSQEPACFLASSRRCMPEPFGSISFLGPSSPNPKSHKRRSNKYVAMPTFLTSSNHYPSSYFYRACRALTDVKIPVVLTLKLGAKVLSCRAVRSVCSTRL